MFTFSCDRCNKMHVVSQPFTGPFKAQCLRCRATIQVTRTIVEVKKADDTRTFRRPPTFPQLKLPAEPTKPHEVVHPPETVKPRRRWPLYAGGGAAVLLATGVGLYFFVGTGTAQVKKVATKKEPVAQVKATTPVRPAGTAPAAASSATVVATAKLAPPAPVPTAKEPRSASRSPRDVASAALAADPAKYQGARLDDVALHDKVLTLSGIVANPAMKAAVETATVQALTGAGFGIVVRVENHLHDPLEVVQEAVAKRCGPGVTVTAVRLEDGVLTLEGDLDKWEHLQPAREVAIQALEEAGLGPIKTWDNHLKKPKK